MVEFLKTLAIACIPAIITGIVTYIVARKNAASQISIIKEQNKHDLEKLMEQHKVDIEHLKEAHRLDMEAKEQDHKNKLELQQKEFENSLLKQQKDGENAMATETIKGVLGMFGSAVTTAMDTPEAKQFPCVSERPGYTAKRTFRRGQFPQKASDSVPKEKRPRTCEIRRSYG